MSLLKKEVISFRLKYISEQQFLENHRSSTLLATVLGLTFAVHLTLPCYNLDLGIIQLILLQWSNTTNNTATLILVTG
jgi:hypothetical protein